MTKELDTAVAMLARREHSADELTRKLEKKGMTNSVATELVMQCQELGLQSDARFAECICRLRVRQGYGPLRIRQELRSQQITDEIINETISNMEIDWLSCVQIVWEKKFLGAGLLGSNVVLEKQKQQKFLLYRGFPIDLIQEMFRLSLAKT